MFYLGTEEKVFAKIFDEEPERDKSVKERNTLRKKLLSTFESISVSIFPIPGQNLRDLDPSTASEEFQKRVDQLKNDTLRQMCEPRKFGTNAVNSQNVDSLVRTFVKQLEDGNIVHVKSAVRQYQHEEIDNEKRCFEESLEEYCKKIDVPVKDELESQLIQENYKLLEKFKDKTANIDLEVEYRDKVLERLKNFARNRMNEKMRENQLIIEATKAKQRETLTKSVNEFKSAVKSELIRNSEMESAQMQQHFEEQMEVLVDSFKANTEQLDWIQELVQVKLEEVKNWTEEKFEEKVEATKRIEQARGV